MATPVGEIATALYFGPTPAPDAITRSRELLADAGASDAGAAILAYLGGLEAQRGDFGRARELLDTAQSRFEDLGLLRATLNTCAALRADIEMLAGRDAVAESVLRDLCSSLERIGDWNHLSSRAADLAHVLCRQGRYHEAHEWAKTSNRRSARDDLATQIRLQSALAMIASGLGKPREAIRLGRRAVQLAQGTDALNLQARARLALAEVVRPSDDERASRLVVEAYEIYEKKGNTAAATRISELMPPVAPV